MVADLRALGLPTPGHKDFIRMPEFKEVQTATQFHYMSDRIVTLLTFPGKYNKGEVNFGEPVTVQIIHFLDEDHRLAPSGMIRVACITAIAAFAIGCQVLEGKRTAREKLHADHAQRLRALMQYDIKFGKIFEASQVVADGGCCTYGRLIPFADVNIIGIVDNKKILGGPLRGDERNAPNVVVQMDNDYVDKFVSVSGLKPEFFLPKK